MKAPTNGYLAGSGEGERKSINSELWHACAGPLVSLPPVGSLVVYFPQGHSEQVAASMQKDTSCIPSYPNLSSKLICMLHNVTLHADPETDEVYAQMTLQPVSKYDKEALLASDMGLKQSRQPTEFFCKTLTASDTSTHGGFSVPRRAAEKIFPPLDFSMQPPAQELIARDLHDTAWTFRHIYRGQPKRHLLTTGWSVFVSTKRLMAGDSVLFIRDEKSLLLLGIRRANRQQPPLSSSVISSDSMHIGILAAAAHAAANNSPFTIFYNPRASPCEFVIPLAKYNKAMYTQVSLGMRFRMMFETEESGVRRYMGTITGISDLDTVRWKNSQWRNLQVGWDESTAGERPSRVSIWEIEPVVTPFYICPPPFFRPKFSRPFQDEEPEMENAFKRAIPWLGDDYGLKDATASSMFPGLSLVQWMNMQQNNQFPSAHSGFLPSIVSSTALHDTLGVDDPSKLLSFQAPPPPPAPNIQFNIANQQSQAGQIQQPPFSWPQQKQQLLQPQQQPHHQATVNNVVSPNQIPNQTSQPPVSSQLEQQHLLNSSNQSQQSVHATNKHSFPLPSLPQGLPSQQQMEQQPALLQRHQPPQTQMHQSPPHLQQPQLQQSSPQALSEHQLQLQLLQKLQQQQQLLSPISSQMQPQLLQKQNHQLQQLPLSPSMHQQLGGNSFSTAGFVPSQQLPVNQHKSLADIRAHSGFTDGNTPSCSTSPSDNNCRVSPSNLFNNNQPAPLLLGGDSVAEHANNVTHELQFKSDTRVKHDLPNLQFPDQLKLKSAVTDQMEVSSSTSYCLEATQNFALPALWDGDVQSHPQNNLSVTANVDGLAPVAFLSRGFDSRKDLQNLISGYGNTPRDIETELSTAGLSSQSFGVPNMTFKPGCSNDVSITDAGVLSNGLWANQTQAPRLRTFTKVQKRGSVGRSIDVTRYKGYDELRQELAQMFGIEGQLEDSQLTDWKLVYVDHENDILLVGDDPWEEFVSCVQSIKILSYAEVQQMSLDGAFGHVPIPNHACSGTDSGNAWNYDDNSAASFNR